MPDSRNPMRVGVYVDAFNVYYGGKRRFGASTQNWRWLNLHSLARGLITDGLWAGAEVARLVYCTAIRDVEGDVGSADRQRAYIAALTIGGPTEIVLGHYQITSRVGLIAQGTSGRRRRPVLFHPGDDESRFSKSPFELRVDSAGEPVVQARIKTFEEKGSDVNVAAHLLRDAYEHKIDAAIVLSNDGDLGFALSIAREHIAIAVVNPSQNPTAQPLRGNEEDGVGGNWWVTMSDEDFRKNQFPRFVGPLERPANW